MKCFGYAWRVGVLSSALACSTVSGQTYKVLSNIGTKQECPEPGQPDDQPCRVEVRVKIVPGGCLATVPIETVTVHGKSTRVVFWLHKDESGGVDPNDYEFIGYGIKWVDPIPPSDPKRDAAAAREASKDFVFVPYAVGDKPEPKWDSQGRKLGIPHAYEPRVRMKSTTLQPNCTATDPRIAND